MTNVTRNPSLPEHTSVIYFAETDGNLTEAATLIELMGLFSLQQVVLRLNREVVTTIKRKSHKFHK